MLEKQVHPYVHVHVLSVAIDYYKESWKCMLQVAQAIHKDMYAQPSCTSNVRVQEKERESLACHVCVYVYLSYSVLNTVHFVLCTLY